MCNYVHLFFLRFSVSYSVPVNFFGKGSCNFSWGSHKVKYFNLYEYLSRILFSSVPGQVVVGLLTRDLSLSWNTAVR